jgi:peptidyl-prolyl cis-trans isomerase D
MASPFSIFRKNQKLLIALLGVMCMLAFVVLPQVMQMMESGGGGGGEQIAVTTKYGAINETELRGMQQSRTITNRFVTELLVRSGTVDPQTYRGTPFGPDTEEAVVDTMLMARRAEEMGVVVSNDAVRSFLREITQDKMPSEDIRQAIKGLGVQQSRLFDALRTELTARRVVDILSSGVGVVSASPGERFDYFRRVNARIRAEVVGVPVATLVDEVPPPSEQDLPAFYEQYKEDLPNGNSPDPGFRQPKKVAVEFITAEYASFVDTLAVTAEEVEKYYQEHLEEYKSLDALTADVDAEDDVDVDTSDPNIPLLDRAEALVIDRDITAGPAPDYTPLWDAEAGIRDKLAAASATSRMEDAITAVETEMAAYEKERVQWEIKQASDEAAPEPTLINLAEVASKNGLALQQTGLIAPADMVENYEGLAGSMVAGRSILFIYYAYGDLQMYTPVKSTDADGNRYLAWITEITAERVPELADIKSEVESAWRFQQARTLAIERANELAKEARESGESLAAAFGGHDDLVVITTGPFRWLTSGSVPQFSSPTLRLSEIEGVDRPGRDFMHQPESIAYVIRVSSEDTPEELLRDQFFAANQDMYLQIGQSDVQEVYLTWRKNLLADAGVHWERPALTETRR